MTEKITKEFIIEYLKEYYVKNNKIPTVIDKEHPFSQTTVYNKFGSWNNALLEANIPFNKNKPIEVKCENCNIIFTKLVNQINKSNNNFCNRSCSAIYNNKIIDRTLSEESKNKIRQILKIEH